MFHETFKKYLEVQKVKDIKTIKRVERRLKAYTREDEKFCKRVSGIHAALSSYAVVFSNVLKAYLDNHLVEAVFAKPFSQAVVISVLKDEEFIAFLIQSKLIRRVIKLNYDTKGEIKLRLYSAILCFDDYKKHKWCE
ncbi:hypothetical protein [Candidatus Proelusimicrobium excrementi]|uniref:hypothetical protein n=1 Tax=Candidatus Proelusimicrobium excrementi TaxID=3416222 RepID=UPI003D109540